MSKSYHIPVLLKESIKGLNIIPNGVYVDATFGSGGHTKEILNHLNSSGKVIAFDQDDDAIENKIDDNFAKTLGAKNLSDLKKLIENQISSQYNTALNSISKKEILEQLEKNHKVEIPKNLIENEIKSIPKNPNTNNNENASKL